MLSSTLLLSLLVLSSSSNSVLSLPQSSGAYQFPADAESILEQPLVQNFDCEVQAQSTYGYYADVENNCQVFHICLPMEDDVGEVTDVLQWSFICGNGTIFDQQTLTCNHPADAFPCEEAESLYFTVEFGKIPEEK